MMPKGRSASKRGKKNKPTKNFSKDVDNRFSFHFNYGIIVLQMRDVSVQTIMDLNSIFTSTGRLSGVFFENEIC